MDDDDAYAGDLLGEVSGPDECLENAHHYQTEEDETETDGEHYVVEETVIRTWW